MNILDIAPEHAEQVLAFSNTMGTIPGIVGNVITGYILASSGSWSAVFIGNAKAGSFLLVCLMCFNETVTSVVYSCGGVLFLIFCDDVPLLSARKTGHYEIGL